MSRSSRAEVCSYLRFGARRAWASVDFCGYWQRSHTVRRLFPVALTPSRNHFIIRVYGPHRPSGQRFREAIADGETQGGSAFRRAVKRCPH